MVPPVIILNLKKQSKGNLGWLNFPGYDLGVV
jgi:hypothetical protein